jgi:hypothetical protein
MRRLGKLILFMSLAFVLVGFTESQQPGGGFGGKGKGGGANDYFSLLNNPQVKGELKVTDEQAAKVPAAGLKVLKEVLDDKQYARLQQIYLRQKGNAAYLEADVKKELKITDEQAKKIQAALDAQAKEQAALFEDGFPGFEKIQELQKSAADKIQAALTDTQKAAWTRIIGEPFELKGGGGFGGKGGNFGDKKGKGGKGKKKDA